MKHLLRFNESFENDNEELVMTFGDDKTIFKSFDTEQEENEFLQKNGGRVNLSYTGFAEEWEDWIDFEKSYAYIENGKLHVVVYGLPKHINKSEVEKYFKETLNQYIRQGYGEFFETYPGHPICMIVDDNGREVVV